MLLTQNVKYQMSEVTTI